MTDDSDDPVMALLATQRAVLAAMENLASQVEAMQGKLDVMNETLAQLASGNAAGAAGEAARVPTLGDRFRRASNEEATADPELRRAQGHYYVAQAIANSLHKGNPDGPARELARAREWLADQLDKGRALEIARMRSTDTGKVAVVDPIHEEMFGGRVKVQRPDRERTR